MPRTDEGYVYKNKPPEFRPVRDLLVQTVEDSIDLAEYAGHTEDYYRVVLIPKGYLYTITPVVAIKEK